MRILITGGAGFIGSHLVDALIARGHVVKVFDNLEPQVHGDTLKPPEYLHKEAEFIFGDVRDREALLQAVQGVEVIYHLAAATGVGQSMYQIAKYVSVNVQGTANLLDILANERHRVQRLILASSRAAYGEGKYLCAKCGIVTPIIRHQEQLNHRDWEIRCPNCQRHLSPLPTDEAKPLLPRSVYGISKHQQEQLCLCIREAYEIPVVILRYFNVYGPRQSLSNPYTGILSIFTAAIEADGILEIYEDGLQSRDFIHVQDVVRATLLAMDRDQAMGQAINVGTGKPLTILEVANTLRRKCGAKSSLEFVQKFRVGDIRHCYADTSRAERVLGFQSEIDFEEGVEDFLNWAAAEKAQDLQQVAKEELMKRNLYRG